MNDESWLPGADEPMGEYLKSNKYHKSAAEITFSDFKGQEEANYAFWRQLTPSQRIELHTIMNNSIYNAAFHKNAGNENFELVFTIKSI
jgi:hypothetical protein